MYQEYLKAAQSQHYALGSFNVNTYDEMVAIVEAALPFGRPVILMASMSCAEFMGVDVFPKLVSILRDHYSIPVLAHLDHCTKPDLLLRCVESGFDSVMYDGSQQPLAANIEITRQLAQICHSKQVSLEGELGVIPGDEGPVKSAYGQFTDPDIAHRFCEETGVDALAVSIGNRHGWYQGQPKLQFDLLAQLVDACNPVPLVLHGGTGIPESDIRHAVEMGICKVNVGTELRKAYINGIHSYAAENDPGDVRPFVKHLRHGTQQAALPYLQALGGIRRS